MFNIEPNSKFLVKQNLTKDWKLETKKDYPLQLVIETVKDGKLPNQDDRKQLPPITNLYLNCFNFLFVKDEPLYLQRPVMDGKTSPPQDLYTLFYAERIGRTSSRWSPRDDRNSGQIKS